MKSNRVRPISWLVATLFVVALGLPGDVAVANPDNGSRVTVARGCVGCHALDPAVTMTGSTWYHIGATAVSRVPVDSPRTCPGAGNPQPPG